MPNEVVLIGGDPLTPEVVVRVARGGARVAVHPAAREAVRASRSVVEQIIGSGRPVYGLNTGVGADCQTPVPSPSRGRRRPPGASGGCWRAATSGRTAPPGVCRILSASAACPRSTAPCGMC